MAVMEGVPVPAEMMNTPSQPSWNLSLPADENGILDQPLMSTPDAKLVDPSACFDTWAGGDSHLSTDQIDSMTPGENVNSESWAQNALSLDFGAEQGEPVCNVGHLELATDPSGVPLSEARLAGASPPVILPAAPPGKTPIAKKVRKNSNSKGKAPLRAGGPCGEPSHGQAAQYWYGAGFNPSSASSSAFFLGHPPFNPEMATAFAVNQPNSPMRLWPEQVAQRRFSESDQESPSNSQSTKKRGAHVRNRPEMQQNARDGQKHWARKVQELRRDWITARIWEHHSHFRQQIAMCKRCHIKSQHECLLRKLQVAYADGMFANVNFSENSEDSFLGWASFQVKPNRSRAFREMIEGMFPGFPTKNTVNNVLRRAHLLPEHSWSGAWSGESTFMHSESHRAEASRASGASEAEDSAAGPLAAIAGGAEDSAAGPLAAIAGGAPTSEPSLMDDFSCDSAQEVLLGRQSDGLV